MTYSERINNLLETIDTITNELQSNFYFAESDQMHQKLSRGWSAVEELEYANLRCYLYLDMLKQSSKKSVVPDASASHSIGFFARYAIKKDAMRPDEKRLPDEFIPVSRRDNPEPVRIKEQKVFSDLLDLFDAWKTILNSGLTSEDLRAVKLRGGFLNLFRMDALEVITLCLEIIRSQMNVAVKAVAVR
jgi:hypothetical protein